MNELDYVKRQGIAKHELKLKGLFVPAVKWLQKHQPPKNWQGTPLEYAQLEMPTSAFLRWLGF